MFSYQKPLTFTVEETDETVSSYNNIDPQLYFKLRQARVTVYNIIRNRAFLIEERCMLYLDFAKKLQKKLDTDRVDLMDYEIQAYAQADYLQDRLKDLKKKYGGKNHTAYENIPHFFDCFASMEVINPDWYVCLERNSRYFKNCSGAEDYERELSEFAAYYKEKEYEYEQLMMYYVYRYFLNAVNDSEILLKAKIGVIGYLILKHLDMQCWLENGKTLTFTQQVDLAHLYSRQFEHSYTIAVFNRSAYNSFFLNQRGGRLRDNTDPHAHFHKIKGRTGIVIDTEPVRTQVLVLKFFPQKVFPAAVYDKRELRKIIKRNGRRTVVGKK